MTPTPSVTLFSGQIDTGRASASLLASAAIHAGVVALISFGILTAPQIDVRISPDRLMVRDVDLHTPEEPAERAAKGIPYPGPAPHPATSAAPASPLLRLATHAPRGPQTLIQPDVTKRLALAEEVPVPRVMIWRPSRVVVKHVVAPTPEPAAAALAHASLDRPNQELQVADVDLAASNLPSLKLKVLPSTSSPVVQQNAPTEQASPSSVAQTKAAPTPAAVLSDSSLQMKNGTAVLPPVNETASVSTPGKLDGGTPAGPGVNGAGAGASGSGTGQHTLQKPATAAPQGTQAGTAGGAPQGTATGTAQKDSQATRIALPRNGQFGAVVVGDSLEDEFPETSGVWSGRMAYTVYLHVGLARSWILQYALPADADAAAAGEVSRIEAPWPYSIVRPNLAPDAVDADAILVHGFIGPDGHFQSLSVVFPPALPQAQFVLKSLGQWQFRPAVENGQSARVEVLLIIPEELD